MINVKNYTHILGQKVVGYRNSKVLGIDSEGRVDFEYEVSPGVIKEENRDFSEINIATISDA